MDSILVLPDDPNWWWNLQCELLGLAESLLGPRDNTKLIGQPAFHDGVPFTQLTRNPDGAHVVLSRGANQYFPTTIYEMAHETVHLLNPVERNIANYLEEGIAVEFSLIAQRLYRVPLQSPETASYKEALKLVNLLTASPIEAARRIRVRTPSLSRASEGDLSQWFSGVSPEVIGSLCNKFYAH